MTESSREGWPDVAKGVCIILVVFWHVVTKHVQHVEWGDASGIAQLWTLLSAQLLPLRMPLFFLVSGLFATGAVFSQRATTALQRAGRLVLLYALWLTMQTFALAATPDFDTARARSPGEFLAHLTVSPTNLWYLLALAVYLIVARLTRSVPTPLLLAAAFVASALAAAGLLPDSENLWQVVQNLFFFLLGLRMRARTERFAAVARVWTTIAWASVFAAALVLVDVLDAREWFGVWPVLSVLAVLVGVAACALLDRSLPRVVAPLRWLGGRTLPIYVIHMIPLALLDQVLRTSGVQSVLATPVMAVIEPVLITAIVVGTCLAVHGALVWLRLGVLFDPLVVMNGRRGLPGMTQGPAH